MFSLDLTPLLFASLPLLERVSLYREVRAAQCAMYNAGSRTGGFPGGMTFDVSHRDSPEYRALVALKAELAALVP